MADFTTIRPMFNTGVSDATPTFSAITFGGTAGANEIRWTSTGAGAGGTASASWPQYSRPVATQAVPECWAFTADTTGNKITTYNGQNTSSNVACIDYDGVGTFAAPPTLSAWGDNSHVAPSPGTQPGAQSGSPIINGSADTSNTSYLKGNMWGQVSATTIAAGAAGTTLLVTSGTAGSVSPTAGANWIATWQSLQGAVQYITFPSTPAATTASRIFWTFALFTGPTMSLGTLLPVITFTYSYV